ncbi:adenylate/guanylate cyclase domain-containing protein [Oryzomonas japonica]|uniref:Adenylate/guanylate cyclase domain-containing protein n=1 Tax=Oryzomonas japonica TaxID=2603858 RepID=A0A7J4ZQM4_9BACT|nr:adenylate/guanylate cyclase domain-containing protein [Oryzomonas japonica]KAB0665360.1 adenylate/guanylate cyclase domain-containing protein [Oryzomonas japonica]
MPAPAPRTVSAKSLRIVLLSLASLLLASLTLTPLFSSFELKSYDLLSRLLNPERGGADIVIVQVDQPSLDALAAEGVTWPWPRQVYAPVFERLAQADAVFVDILFTEPSSYGEEDDQLLAAAVARAGNVILPVFATANRRENDAAGQAFLDRMTVNGVPAPAPALPSAITPIAPLARGAHGGGNVMIKPDRDGVYRRLPLLFQAAGRTLPHFVLGHLLERRVVSVREGRLVRGAAPLPLDGGALLPRFPRGTQPYRAVSIQELIRDDGRSAYPASWFKGKKVFLGLTAAGLYDLKPTAVSAVTSGVQVHAATLDALLHGAFLQRVPDALSIVFMAAIAAATCAFILTHTSIAANLALLAGLLLASLGVPALLFSQGVYLPLLPPLVALAVAFAAASTYSYATEGRERRFVRRAFSQYMDETVVAHLLKHPDLIKPGGQRRRVTVFFADIAGFTTIAEQFPPEETALMLHDVLNAVSEEVIGHEGVIDKYIGDCVMAFWGAPLARPDAERNACRAALAAQTALERVNASFKNRGLGTISLRIGLHTGDAIVGNLGSDRLFDYTVVGDTVNLASRLESANKFFATRIMLSEATLREAGDGFLARELGLIAVKGKELPVRIHELLAERDGAPVELAAWVALYGRAVDAFHHREWQAAAALFEEALSQRPQDGPALFYLDWCRRCLETPPLTDDWNVIHMKEK